MSQMGGCNQQQQHRVYDFAKMALIKIFAHPYATVCDLYCGGGTDADKWVDAQIGHYIGIDGCSSAIEQIREAWDTHRKSYTADFFHCDPSTENIETHLEEKLNTADFVCCLQHLQVRCEHVAYGVLDLDSAQEKTRHSTCVITRPISRGIKEKNTRV